MFYLLWLLVSLFLTLALGEIVLPGAEEAVLLDACTSQNALEKPCGERTNTKVMEHGIGSRITDFHRLQRGILVSTIRRYK